MTKLLLLLVSTAFASPVDDSADFSSNRMDRGVELIPIAGGWSGRGSGIRDRKSAVIRDAAAWREFWKRHRPDETAPRVDFDKHLVAACFLKGATHARPRVGVLAAVGLPGSVELIVGIFTSDAPRPGFVLGKDPIEDPRLHPFVFALLPRDERRVNVVLRGNMPSMTPNAHWVLHEEDRTPLAERARPR